MNGKTGKLIRLYVGARKAGGKAISLKDFKRRYQGLPWNRRERIRDAMMAFILEKDPPDRRELRASRPRWGSVERKRSGGLLGFVAHLLGFTG